MVSYSVEKYILVSLLIATTEKYRLEMPCHYTKISEPFFLLTKQTMVIIIYSMACCNFRRLIFVLVFPMTFSQPICFQCTLPLTPESIRKPKVFSEGKGVVHWEQMVKLIFSSCILVQLIYSTS